MSSWESGENSAAPITFHAGLEVRSVCKEDASPAKLYSSFSFAGHYHVPGSTSKIVRRGRLLRDGIRFMAKRVG